MKSSFNFEGYRNDLAKDIKQLRQEGQNDLAKEKLEKAREDIRYEISTELHRLEKRIESEKGLPSGSVERQREIPPDWERLDINEQIPEWAKLLIDFYRLVELAIELKVWDAGIECYERAQILRSKIIEAYLADEYIDFARKDVLTWEDEDPDEELSEYISAVKSENFSISDTLKLNSLKAECDKNFLKKKIADLFREIIQKNLPHTKEIYENYESSNRIDNPFLTTVIGGYNSARVEYPHGPREHTLEESAGFDLRSKIHGNKIWLSDPLTTRYSDVTKPLLIFSAKNPYFNEAHRTGKSFVNESYEETGRIDETTGILVSMKPRWDPITKKEIQPTFAEYADAFVDLVHGEMLVHKYSEDKIEQTLE